jgi:hypothetical protein
MASCHSLVSLMLCICIKKPRFPGSFNMYLVINKCVTAVKVSNFSGHYLRNRSTLDISVLGYIGILYRSLAHSSWDTLYSECPERDCKIIIGHMNAKVGNEDVFRPVTGKNSLHTESNDIMRRD